MADYVVGSAADPNLDRRDKRRRIEAILTEDLVQAGGGDDHQCSAVAAGIVHSYLVRRNTYAFDFVLAVGGNAVAEMLVELRQS